MRIDMPKLMLQLTRISPTEHVLAYGVDGIARERLTLETKTFLFHDLLHFALETEAHLIDSFYGLLASAGRYQDLARAIPTKDDVSEIAQVERIVGGLTGVIKQGLATEAFLAFMKNIFEAHGEALPIWLTPELVERVKERMRELQGEWNGTPFGSTMVLEFLLP